MKKTLKYIGIIMISLVVLVSDVLATNETNSGLGGGLNISEGRGISLLCEYLDSAGDPRVRINYSYAGKEGYSHQWQFYYTPKDKKDEWKTIQGRKGIGTFNDFTKGDVINYEEDKHSFGSDFENKFVCPAYVNLEYDGPYHRMCFSNTTEQGQNGRCSDYGDIFETQYVLSNKSNTEFNLIMEYAKNKALENVKPEAAISKSAKDLIVENTRIYVNSILASSLPSDYVFPKFYENFADNILDYVGNKTDDFPTYKRFRDKVVALKNQKLAQVTALGVKLGATTDEQEKAEIQKQINTLNDEIHKSEINVPEVIGNNVRGGSLMTVDPSDEKTCNGLLGPTMTKIVKNVFKTVQMLGPILVGIFTILDFGKAALSGEADDMKKASNKFAKRVVFAILLFFVPLLCNILFELAGITLPDICITQ